jgi:hypothetical protein
MTTSTATRRPTALLTVHLLATAGWLGAGLAVSGLTVAGLAGGDPITVYPAARIVAVWVVAPLVGLSLVSGVLLAITTSWGLFTHGWVTAKLAISLLLAAAVAVLLVPRLGAVAAIATEPGPSTLTTTQRLPLAVAPAVASLLLGVNVVLAVAKPGTRRRTSHLLGTERS